MSFIPKHMSSISKHVSSIPEHMSSSAMHKCHHIFGSPSNGDPIFSLQCRCKYMKLMIITHRVLHQNKFWVAQNVPLYALYNYKEGHNGRLSILFRAFVTLRDPKGLEKTNKMNNSSIYECQHNTYNWRHTKVVLAFFSYQKKVKILGKCNLHRTGGNRP